MISMDCRMSKRFLSKSHIKTYKKKKAVKLNGDLFSDKADSRFFVRNVGRGRDCLLGAIAATLTEARGKHLVLSIIELED